MLIFELLSFEELSFDYLVECLRRELNLSFSFNIFYYSNLLILFIYLTLSNKFTHLFPLFITYFLIVSKNLGVYDLSFTLFSTFYISFL